MMTITRVSLKLRRAFDSIRKACHGQDLIEYALMAGFVAVAVTHSLKFTAMVSGALKLPLPLTSVLTVAVPISV